MARSKTNFGRHRTIIGEFLINFRYAAPFQIQDDSKTTRARPNFACFHLPTCKMIRIILKESITTTAGEELKPEWTPLPWNGYCPEVSK